MVHGQGRVQQSGERPGETGICDLVPSSATLGLRNNDATVTKAGQVVGDVGRTEIQFTGECRGIDRAIKQSHENA